MKSHTFLTTGVRWCPTCVLRARDRGTVRAVPQLDGPPRLELVHGDRVAGELVMVMDRGPCHACGDVTAPRWAVQSTPKARGLGRSPREPAQRALPFTKGRRG